MTILRLCKHPVMGSELHPAGTVCGIADRPRFFFDILAIPPGFRYAQFKRRTGGLDDEVTAENSLMPVIALLCVHFCLALFRPALLYRLGLRNCLTLIGIHRYSGSGNLLSPKRHHSSGNRFSGKSGWHSNGSRVAAGYYPADQICDTGQSLSIIRLSAKDERCEPPVFFYISGL